MDNALSPREIQTRIREGASTAEVADETGMPLERVAAFAGPVLAEREHIAAQAQVTTLRRRGETGSHRRLGDLIAMRLTARGISASQVVWDSWRQPDLKWRVTAHLEMEAMARTGEFVFDPKGRFSVALNADARWLVGEEQVGARPEDENTVDFNDELALVRATEETPKSPKTPSSARDEVPASHLMHEANEDTSQLDRLYDMLSGISEDSVRIYTGLVEHDGAQQEPTTDLSLTAQSESDQPADLEDYDEPAAPEHSTEPVQDSLVADDTAPVKRPKPRKGRAKVPSWDEIMFGGPAT